MNAIRAWSTRLALLLCLIIVVAVSTAFARWVTDRPVPTATAPRTSAQGGPAQDASGLARLMFFGGISYSELATRQADSAYRWGLQHRVEPSLCVASGGFARGMSASRKPFVFIFAFATQGPQAAAILQADSLTINWKRSICGDSLPSWHGHVVANEVRNRPSDCDLHMAASRPDVAFHIVQTDTNRAALYWYSEQLATVYGSTKIAWCGHQPEGS